MNIHQFPSMLLQNNSTFQNSSRSDASNAIAEDIGGREEDVGFKGSSKHKKTPPKIRKRKYGSSCTMRQEDKEKNEADLQLLKREIESCSEQADSNLSNGKDDSLSKTNSIPPPQEPVQEGRKRSTRNKVKSYKDDYIYLNEMDQAFMTNAEKKKKKKNIKNQERDDSSHEHIYDHHLKPNFPLPSLSSKMTRPNPMGYPNPHVSIPLPKKQAKKPMKSVLPKKPMTKVKMGIPIGIPQKKQYCICRSSESGEMIECGKCKDWFHFQCIDLDPNKKLEFESESYIYICPFCQKHKSKDQYASLPKKRVERPKANEYSEATKKKKFSHSNYFMRDVPTPKSNAAGVDSENSIGSHANITSNAVDLLLTVNDQQPMKKEMNGISQSNSSDFEDKSDHSFQYGFTKKKRNEQLIYTPTSKNIKGGRIASAHSHSKYSTPRNFLHKFTPNSKNQYKQNLMEKFSTSAHKYSKQYSIPSQIVQEHKNHAKAIKKDEKIFLVPEKQFHSIQPDQLNDCISINRKPRNLWSKLPKNLDLKNLQLSSILKKYVPEEHAIESNNDGPNPNNYQSLVEKFICEAKECVKTIPSIYI